MKGVARRGEWLAPFLVGAAGAIAAEVAIGILLYAGPGLLRSLTTVLAVEAGAFAAGLWRAPPGHSELIDHLRRRWLFCLATYVAAAFFGTSWSVVQDLGGGPLGQGVGLALLAALPLYSCGLVLGGMGALVASDPVNDLRAPGAAAALGAAMGFVITGFLLPRAPMPASLLVACLVILSASGMIFGAALGSRSVVHVRAVRSSGGGSVRVEDRVVPGRGEGARYLLEGAHVRRRVSRNGDEEAPWDELVALTMIEERPGARRILLVGGGASSLQRAISEGHPEVRLEVLERNPAVLELAREYLDAPLETALPDRVRVTVGNLDDLLLELRQTYDVVVVDASALAHLGGVGGLSQAARSALLASVGPNGAMVWGPCPPDPSATSWLEQLGAVAVCRTEREEERVLVVRRAEGAALGSGSAGELDPSGEWVGGP